MSLGKIKLITFDATNTLLKFRVPPWQYYAVVAKDHGFRGSGDDIKGRLLDSFKVMNVDYPNFGKSKIDWAEWWTKVVKRTFQDILPKDADINIIAKQLIEEFKTDKCWCVAAGVSDLLNILRSRKVSLGVISNFDPRLHDILKSVDLYKYFDFVLTSYDVGYSKPDRKIFKLARLECPKKPTADECLHIGDELKKDYLGAKAAGWNAILVTEEVHNEMPPANHVFKTVEDFKIAIERNRPIL